MIMDRGSIYVFGLLAEGRFDIFWLLVLVENPRIVRLAFMPSSISATGLDPCGRQLATAIP